MWVLRVAAVAMACAISPQSDAPVPPSQAAEAYFEHATALIRQKHRNSLKADWTTILARARPMLAGAVGPADTYPAIREVLTMLGERHSFLLPPAGIAPPRDARAPSAARAGSTASPTWAVVGKVGALRLPALNTFGPDGVTKGAAYTAAVRSGLLDMDKRRLCGWIVDLRDNGGGNMWPMLKGLDPLLGTAPFGYFVQTDGSTQAWSRSAGNIFPAAEKLASNSPAFSLTHASAPLALLIGPATGSSGEMVAIALIGRKDVRVFGSASAGLTTGNKVYPLPDGAALVLTEVSVRDRAGRDYSGPIVPDEQIAPSEAEGAAVQWLEKRCATGRA